MSEAVATQVRPSLDDAQRLERLLRIAVQCSGSEGAWLEAGANEFRIGERADDGEIAIVTDRAKLVLVKPRFPSSISDIAALLIEETSQQTHADFERAIGEAAAARAHAEANAQRLAFALDMARTAAWELDLDGPRLVGGDELSKFFGTISAQDILQLHKTRLHPDDLPAYSAFQAQLQKGLRADIEHRLRDDSGERWVRTTGVALARSDQRAPHYVFLTTDITERRAMEAAFTDSMREAANALAAKRALLQKLVGETDLEESINPPLSTSARSTFEDLHRQLALLLREISRRDSALERAVRDLDRARSEAEAASEAKTRFLSAMTHELRTPLNAVINYAEMLEEEILEHGLADSAADLARIKNAALDLLGVITNVLEYSDLESGRARIHPQTFVFVELFNSIKPEMEKLAKGNRNQIEFRLDENIGCVETDWRRLRQCLDHLVGNAAKFTHDGKIKVSARREQHMLVLEVADTGCGIDSKAAPSLMAPFVQADSSLTRAHGGVGLGLAIAGQLARHLGGRLSFVSSPGEGSTFTLRVAV